jgi:hypothetical protein
MLGPADGKARWIETTFGAAARLPSRARQEADYHALRAGLRPFLTMRGSNRHK